MIRNSNGPFTGNFVAELEKNWKPIRQRYEQNKCRFLDDMFWDDSSAHVAIFWMNRSLYMIHDVLNLMVNQNKSSDEAVDIAYNAILKPYHSGLVQGVFKVSCS